MLISAVVSCRILFLQELFRADSRAALTAGNSRPTSVPMIAITTNSSTSVNARRPTNDDVQRFMNSTLS